jgi:hypothetical protein
MSQTKEYKYLLADYWAPTKILFIKDPRKFRADLIYGQSVGEDARTPEELAADFKLPLEAVLEAIDYCTQNEELVRQEREKENARRDEYYKKYPPLVPPDFVAEQ